jgi:hypothetical protein
LAFRLSQHQPLLQFLGSQLSSLLRQPPHSPTDYHQDQEKKRQPHAFFYVSVGKYSRRPG